MPQILKEENDYTHRHNIQRHEGSRRAARVPKMSKWRPGAPKNWTTALAMVASVAMLGGQSGPVKQVTRLIGSAAEVAEQSTNLYSAVVGSAAN